MSLLNRKHDSLQICAFHCLNDKLIPQMRKVWYDMNSYKNTDWILKNVLKICTANAQVQFSCNRRHKEATPVGPRCSSDSSCFHVRHRKQHWSLIPTVRPQRTNFFIWSLLILPRNKIRLAPCCPTSLTILFMASTFYRINVTLTHVSCG